MAGFLGLGGSSESYFLDPEESKSMGNTEYMKTPKKVKHKFVKTEAWGEIEDTETNISAFDKKGGSISPSNSQSTPTYSTPSYTPPSFSTPTFTPPPAPSFTPPAPAPTPEPQAAAEKEEPQQQPPQPSAPPVPPANQGSNDMDMFRSMAKKIR